MGSAGYPASMPRMPGYCNPCPIVAGAALALITLVSGAAPAPVVDAKSLLREAFRLTMSRPVRFEGSLTRFDPNDQVHQSSRWRFERSGEPGQGCAKITFLEPPALQGVKLLMRSSPGRPAEQWLYTPATDRARPVRPAARGRRFYSTDFTFDDLQDADSGLRSYRLSGKREAVGELCWRIEADTGADSPYDQKAFFISEAKGVIVQTDCFLDSSRVKRLIYRGYEERDGVWLAGQIDAIDIEAGWRTVLVVEEAKVDAAFSASTFEPESLGLP